MKNKREFLNLVSAYASIINEQSVNPGQFQAPTGGANPNQFQASFTGNTNPSTTNVAGSLNNPKPTSSSATNTSGDAPVQQGTSEADKVARELFRAQYSKFKELAKVKDPNAFVDSVRKMFPNEPNVVKMVDNMVKSEPGNLQNIINSINKMVGMENTEAGQSIMSTFGGTIE